MSQYPTERPRVSLIAQMNPITTALVLPAYNKASVIRQCLEGLLHVSDDEGLSLSILVVDDGSSDNTADVVRRFEDNRVQLLELGSNHGKGAAIRSGVAHLGGMHDNIGWFDADLDIFPSTFALLARALERLPGTDGVIASKTHPESTIDYPITRRIGSMAFSLFVRTLIGVRFRDTQTGAKLFRAQCARALTSQCVIDGFAFDVEILALAEKNNHTIVEAPAELKLQIGSTVSISNILSAFRDVLTVRRALQRTV